MMMNDPNNMMHGGLPAPQMPQTMSGTQMHPGQPQVPQQYRTHPNMPGPQGAQGNQPQVSLNLNVNMTQTNVNFNGGQVPGNRPVYPPNSVGHPMPGQPPFNAGAMPNGAPQRGVPPNFMQARPEGAAMPRPEADMKNIVEEFQSELL
jgi:hypothetical protein